MPGRFMLNATSPETIKVARGAMVSVGFKTQQLANDLFRRLARKLRKGPPPTSWERLRCVPYLAKVHAGRTGRELVCPRFRVDNYPWFRTDPVPDVTN